MGEYLKYEIRKFSKKSSKEAASSKKFESPSVNKNVTNYMKEKSTAL